MKWQLDIDGMDGPLAERALGALAGVDLWEAACASHQLLLDELGGPDYYDGKWTEEHSRLAVTWDKACTVSDDILYSEGLDRFQENGPSIAIIEADQPSRNALAPK